MTTPCEKDNNKEIIMDNGYTISSAEIKRIQVAVEKSEAEKFPLFTRMMRIHFMLQMPLSLKSNSALVWIILALRYFIKKSAY
jgi:hypothetical protein